MPYVRFVKEKKGVYIEIPKDLDDRIEGLKKYGYTKEGIGLIAIYELLRKSDEELKKVIRDTFSELVDKEIITFF